MVNLLVLNIDKLNQLASLKGKAAKTPGNHLKNSVLRARNILKILRRDNFRCVECGSDYRLTIDHTDGRKFAKHDNAQKYRLNKCRTLCELCHMIKNGWVKKSDVDGFMEFLKRERNKNKSELS